MGKEMVCGVSSFKMPHAQWRQRVLKMSSRGGSGSPIFLSADLMTRMRDFYVLVCAVDVPCSDTVCDDTFNATVVKSLDVSNGVYMCIKVFICV